MAFLSAIKTMNDAQSFEEAFKATDITSDAMKAAINAWFNLYYDVDLGTGLDPSQRVPYIIVDGLYKAVFGEYEYSLDESSTEGKLLKTMLDSFDKRRAEAFQQANIGGEALIKPIIKRDNFIFSVISRNNMTVLARDAEGNITDLVTGELTVKSSGNSALYYWLLERRTLDADGYCTMENRLYKSTDKSMLGQQVALSTLPEYAELQPKFTFTQPTYNLGLVPVVLPTVNCVDGSADGVSIFAAAAKEVMTLYRHESRTNAEYRLTEPHLLVSDDIQRRDHNGKLIEIPEYVTPIIDADLSDVGLNIWNPAPNQVELEARDDQIKREIENIIGLRRGFLSKSDVQEFTATEIVSTTTKMAHLVKDLQDMWSGVIPEVMRTCIILANMYGLSGWTSAEPPEIAISYGDGILYDEDKEFNRLSLMVSSGDLRPEYRLGWYFDMPTDTPEDLDAIREKYMPDEIDGDEIAEEDEV